MRTRLHAKHLTRLILVIVCAALAFGGTFECRGSSGDDDDDDDFTRPARQEK